MTRIETQVARDLIDASGDMLRLLKVLSGGRTEAARSARHILDGDTARELSAAVDAATLAFIREPK